MAVQIFEAFGTIEIKDEKYLNQLKKIEQSQENLAKSADKATKDISKDLSTLGTKAVTFGTKINAGLTKAGAAFTKFGTKAVAAGKKATLALTLPIAALGTQLVKQASDLNESVNAINKIFGDSSDIITEWGETAAQSAGLAQSEVNEAAVVVGALFTNVGIAADEAAEQTVVLAQRSADLASVFNTDVTQALTAVQAGLRGESEPLRRFGVGLSAVAVEAKALELGLAATKKEITEADKVTARYQLILEQTESSAGDFADTADEQANSTRILIAELKNTAAELGQVLLPIVTKVVNTIRDWVQRFGELSDETKNTILIVAGLVAAIGPALLIIGNISKAIGVLAGTALPKLISIIKTGAIVAVKGLSAAFTFLAANPVVAVIAGVAALTTGIVALVSSQKKANAATDEYGNILTDVNGKILSQAEALEIEETRLKSLESNFKEFNKTVAEFAAPNEEIQRLSNLLEEEERLRKKAIEDVEKRADLEAELTTALERETLSRIELLELERKRKLEEAENIGADTVLINELYDIKIAKIEEDAATRATEIRESELEETERLEQEKLALREDFEKQWSETLFQETATRLQILSAERDAALKQAEELGASQSDILKFYATQRNAILQEEIDEREAIAQEEADKVAEAAERILDAREDFEKQWFDTYKKGTESRLQQLDREEKATIDQAIELGASIVNVRKEFDRRRAELQAEAAASELQEQEKANKEKIKAEEKYYNLIDDLREDSLSKELDALDRELQAALDIAEETGKETLKIIEGFNRKRLELIDELIEETEKKEKESLQKTVNNFVTSFNAISDAFLSISGALSESAALAIEEPAKKALEQLDKVQEAKRKSIIQDIQDEEERAEALTKLEQDTAAKRTRIEQARDAEVKRIRKEQFERDKAFMIAATIINGGAAIIRALVDPGGIPGVALSIAAAAQTAKQLVDIRRQSLSFATGGIVPGSPTGGRDSVNTNLAPGEMVLNERQQGNLFSLLNRPAQGLGSVTNITNINNNAPNEIQGNFAISSNLIMDGQVLANQVQNLIDNGQIRIPKEAS